jgi:hypothetical protein
MSVLSWLMNGEKKLFKSPTEGNFIVRLMNVSLSPNDQLGRMLHTFNCTAYEVADFNYNNCKQFGFIKVNNIEKESLAYKTVQLNGVDTTQLNNPFVINPDHDAYSIEFSTTPNAPVIINNSTYFTDDTGYLKFEIDGVTFKAGSIILSYGVSYYGSATYSYKGIPVEGFSNIKNVVIKTMPLRQIEVMDIENNLLDEL